MRGRLAAISSWTLGEWYPVVCDDDIIEIDWLYVKVVYLNDWERRADAETTQNVFQHTTQTKDGILSDPRGTA